MVHVIKRKLSQKFSFWESYFRFRGKSGPQTAFSKAFPKTNRVLGNAQRFVLLLIRLYQCFISPLFPPCCRYVPTCSAYAYEAVVEYGVCRGMFMAVKRILRCHPFHPGGYDPVKPAAPPAEGLYCSHKEV